MKLNPDSAIIHQTDENWHRLMAIVLWKLSRHEPVRITADDIIEMREAFAPDGPIVFTHGTVDAIELSLTTTEKARVIAMHDAKMRGSA